MFMQLILFTSEASPALRWQSLGAIWHIVGVQNNWTGEDKQICLFENIILMLAEVWRIGQVEPNCRGIGDCQLVWTPDDRKFRGFPGQKIAPWFWEDWRGQGGLPGEALMLNRMRKGKVDAPFLAGPPTCVLVLWSWDQQTLFASPCRRDSSARCSGTL